MMSSRAGLSSYVLFSVFLQALVVEIQSGTEERHLVSIIKSQF